MLRSPISDLDLVPDPAAGMGGQTHLRLTSVLGHEPPSRQAVPPIWRTLRYSFFMDTHAAPSKHTEQLREATPTLNWTPITEHDQIDAISLIRHTESNDGSTETQADEQLRSNLRNDARTTCLGARDSNNEIAAIAHVQLVGTESHVTAIMLGAVSPENRRKGIGSAILQWETSEAVSLAKRNSIAIEQRYMLLQSTAQSTNIGLMRLLERSGFSSQSMFCEFTYKLADPNPLPKHEPATNRINIIPWLSPLGHEAEKLAKKATIDPETAKALASTMPSPDDALSLMALDTADHLIGFIWNTTYKHDWKHDYRPGYTHMLCVHPAYRGTPVASKLLTSTFELFQSFGLTHANTGFTRKGEFPDPIEHLPLGYREYSRTAIYERIVHFDHY